MCKCIFRQCAGANGGPKRASNPLHVESEAVLNLLMQMMGTAVWSSVRTTSAFNSQTFTPTLRSFIKEEKDTPKCARGLEAQKSIDPLES